jgi:hypothetical protein
MKSDTGQFIPSQSFGDLWENDGAIQSGCYIFTWITGQALYSVRGTATALHRREIYQMLGFGYLPA